MIWKRSPTAALQRWSSASPQARRSVGSQDPSPESLKMLEWEPVPLGRFQHLPGQGRTVAPEERAPACTSPPRTPPWAVEGCRGLVYVLVAPGDQASVGFVGYWESPAPSPAAALAMPVVTGGARSPELGPAPRALPSSCPAPCLDAACPSPPGPEALLRLCPPCLAPLLPSHGAQSPGI